MLFRRARRSYLFERKPACPGSKETDGQRDDEHCPRDEDEHPDTACTIERCGNDVAGKHCRKPAEGIDETDRAGAHDGGVQLALIRVIGQRHEGGAESDTRSNDREQCKV